MRMEDEIMVVSRGFGPKLGGIGVWSQEFYNALKKYSFNDVSKYTVDTQKYIYYMLPKLNKIPKRPKTTVVAMNVFEGCSKNVDIVYIHDLIPLTTYYISDTLSKADIMKRKIFRFFFDSALTYVIKHKFIITNSDTTTEALARYSKVKGMKRIFNHHYLGFIYPFIYKKVRTHRRRKIKTIGMIGRYEPYKGFEEFGKFAAKNNLKGIVVGSGHDGHDYGKNVEIWGFVKDTKKFWDTIDALVFPSRIEGFGIPIMEAFSRRIPVFIRSDLRIDEKIRKYTHTMWKDRINDVSYDKVKEAYEFSKELTPPKIANKFYFKLFLFDIQSPRPLSPYDTLKDYEGLV